MERVQHTETATGVALRIGGVAASLLVVLLVAAAVVRPEMMMAAVHMVMHGILRS